MKKISLAGVAFVCAFCSLHAQDPRERNYFYEILDPKHEPKPLVEGFAQLAFAGIGCSCHGFPCIS